MTVKVYTLNAFAKTAGGGNPAGVVLDAGELSASQMKSVAKKVGFSETAFMQKSEKADFNVRFFTPAEEVDLCGHATVAAFSLLAQKKILPAGVYTQATKAGLLEVEIRKDNVIFMTQTKPCFFEDVDKEMLAESLNISVDYIAEKIPAKIISTGLRDIIIPVNTLEQLFSIKPDFEKVAEISKKTDAVGYHVFTLKSKYSSTAHCRNFAPLYDIPEEAATGTSSGALASYLYQYGLVTAEDVGNLVFEQGYSMNRPSEILAGLTVQNKEITEVKVGGVSADIKEIKIEI